MSITSDPRNLARARMAVAQWGEMDDAPRITDLTQLQAIIERTFGDRDRARGTPSTVAWLAEEIGELAQAVRKGTPAQQLHEFGDVLAWVATLANQMGIDLTEAVQRYATGCPRCGTIPCSCP